MSHIGEGELHAWLDGALDQLGGGRAAEVREHLRACAACREALVAEEGLRARAAEVLALSVPRMIDAPPFETLLERARGREAAPPPPRRMSRFARMGWAASIVVALGAGWMARDMGLEPTPALEEGRVASPPADAGAEVDAAAEMDVAATPPAAQTSPPAVGRGGDLASARPESRVESPSRGATRGTVGASAVEVTTPPPSALASAEREAAPIAAEIRAASAEPVVGAPRQEALAFGDVRAPTALDRAAPAPPAPAAAAPTSGAATGGGAAQPPRETARSGARVVTSASHSTPSGVGLQQPGVDSVAGVPPLFSARADARAGAVSGVADADEALDISVPGLEVLHVEWSQLAPGQPSRRVLQRLATGDTLEIRFVRSVPRSAADPLATLVSAAPLPGWSQVIKVHRDGWLVARAAIPESELQALVARAGTIR